MKALLALLKTKRWLPAALAAGLVFSTTPTAGAAGGGLRFESTSGFKPASVTTITIRAARISPLATTSAKKPKAGTVRRVTSPLLADGDYTENQGGAGGKNVVKVINQQDNELKVDGSIQVNHIPGANVAPVNYAYAYSSCTDCQTFAVALQINLISKTATSIRPQNTAIALNYQCTRCDTVAQALQYSYQVDDPNKLPNNVASLVKDMNDQLKDLRQGHNLTAAQAESRITAVVAQFKGLAQSLNNQRKEDKATTNPNAKPVPSPSPTPTNTP